MKHVALIDYLKYPHLIQHIDGRPVIKLVHHPKALPSARIRVSFPEARDVPYYEDGRFVSSDTHSQFVLKATPPRTTTFRIPVDDLIKMEIVNGWLTIQTK